MIVRNVGPRDWATASWGVASVTVRPLSSRNADRNRLALRGMSEAERICGRRAEVLAGEQARLKAEFLARAGAVEQAQAVDDDVEGAGIGSRGVSRLAELSAAAVEVVGEGLTCPTSAVPDQLRPVPAEPPFLARAERTPA